MFLFRRLGRAGRENPPRLSGRFVFCEGETVSRKTGPWAALLFFALLLSSPASAPAQKTDYCAVTLATVFKYAEAFPSAAKAAGKMLSEYLPSLAGGAGDTPLYILTGKEEGGTVLVVAGTHGNEIAGVVAAAILAERAQLSKGRLIVIPRANQSAAHYPDPDKPGPPFVLIPTPRGIRSFFYGARRTHPGDEGGPDPARYLHPDSKQPLTGQEARNLDRVYPGDPEGGLTARVAFAIMTLIRREGVDIAIDLHEANPESKLSWALIANPKNVDCAAMAALALEEQGFPVIIDASAAEPRGLSHREWGDRSDAKAFLIETPNPAQAVPSIKRDPVTDAEFPLERRAAAQLAAISALVELCNEELPEDSRVVIQGLPSAKELETGGLGAFLE